MLARYIESKLCETALTFHNDLRNAICRGGEQRERRWSGAEGGIWGYSAGVWASVKKPEDPGYLLLLAAPRTKERGLDAAFCLIANNEGI